MLLIPSLKKRTKHHGIAVIADPPEFHLPLGSYRGTLTPVVKAGDAVKKYQLVAESTGVFAARLHAPASGIITGVRTIAGQEVLCLQNDFREDEAEPSRQAAPGTLAPDDFLQALLDHGIEGAGGARFPAALKYRTGGSAISTVILNGVECEPYLSADYAVMKEEAEPLLEAAQVIRNVTGAARLVIAIERQNKDLKRPLLKTAARLGVPLEVHIVPDTYPQGGELQLIRSVTGLELRKGSIPAAHGVLVSNVGTVRAIHRALHEGRPYIGRVITVSGEGSPRTGNFHVKIGTPVGHILRETGSGWDPEAQRIILGGGMMGVELESPDTPVHKGAGGLLVLRRKPLAAYNCIQCGLCVDVCPQRLMPVEFARAQSRGDTHAMTGLHLPDCIECGACEYACPSDVPLMESIHAGKAALRDLTRA
ncbi:RnfABCDGE type electron transport complex subunit C [Luteolibacter flavescens]|uniref:Ion-translocating oxidoreductase complex subunit C n=1 Tax=Luteolibacter flavescens TaxID=1859460 RepID=A0ABT3FMZ7_9BACT|nr:RnfABCDGE type electron transport complex subunit C [Luteolibacter flavescens]MCW1884928.1 RnfABCDGE type electron transport complex subunit C [Luteolibacter flavescens]